MPGTVLDDVVGATITTARRAVLRAADEADPGDLPPGPVELVFDYTRARTVSAGALGRLDVGLGPWRPPPPSAGRWELVDLAATGVAELRGAQVVAVDWEHDTAGAPVGVRVALDGGGVVRLRSSSGDLHVEAERHR
jgi:hypothetical protein